MKTLFISLLTFLAFTSFGQADTIPPSFTGGEPALKDFIRQNLKYPEEALELSVSGTVIIRFSVDTNGSVKILKAVNKVPAGCTEEAIRIVRLTDKKWIPGKVNNEVKCIETTLSVNFNLQKNITLGPDPFLNGIDLMKQNNYRKAAEEFSRFLKDSITSQAYLARGICYLEMKKFRNSIKDFEAADSLGDSYAKAKLFETYYQFGVFLLQEKNYNVCIELFTKALEYDPKAANAFYDRGNCYYNINDKAKACTDWNMVKTLGSDISAKELNSYCSDN